jgi:hypothetical protein
MLALTCKCVCRMVHVYAQPKHAYPHTYLHASKHAHTRTHTQV